MLASECIKIVLYNQEMNKVTVKNFIRDFIFLTATQTLIIGRHGVAFSTKTPI